MKTLSLVVLWITLCSLGLDKTSATKSVSRLEVQKVRLGSVLFRKATSMLPFNNYGGKTVDWDTNQNPPATMIVTTETTHRALKRSSGSRSSSGSKSSSGSSGYSKSSSASRSYSSRGSVDRDSGFRPIPTSTFAAGGLALFATLIWFQSYKLSNDMRQNTVCYSKSEIEEAVRRDQQLEADGSTAVTSFETLPHNDTLNHNVTSTPPLNLTGLPYDSMLDEIDKYDANEADGIPNELCAVVGGTTIRQPWWRTWTATATVSILAAVIL